MRGFETPNVVVSFAEAMSIVSDHGSRIFGVDEGETVDLLGSAGRVLAQAIVADRNQPPFDRSTRDGFAARASDWAAGGWLQVAGSVRAGEGSKGIYLQPGQAAEIMTGAPVPRGADCVAMVEHVEVGSNGVRLSDTARASSVGDNIVPDGSEARAGEHLLTLGTRMGAAEIALAAACGGAKLFVFARPTVAILATGDELVEVADRPLPHQIRNSNSYALAAQVAEAGGTPQRLPIVRDDLGALLAAIGSARACDLMLLSGGVSMGKYDLVEEALASLGAEFFFTGAKIQPGKPVVFGRLPATEGRAAQYFFGLPGNPISTQVTFQLFVRPLLLALCGDAERAIPFVQATLAVPVQVKPGLTRFLPARLEHDFLASRVSPVKWQGSGDQAAQARANCYLMVPAQAEEIPAGSTVSILLK